MTTFSKLIIPLISCLRFLAQRTFVSDSHRKLLRFCLLALLYQRCPIFQTYAMHKQTVFWFAMRALDAVKTSPALGHTAAYCKLQSHPALKGILYDCTEIFWGLIWTMMFTTVLASPGHIINR